MKAIVVHAAKDVRIEEVAEGEPGPGQVRLRLATGGVCGTDLHYYNHGGFGTVRLKEPMILGHEVSAYVQRLGEGVVGLSVGQLVAVSPSRPCQSCRFCQQGLHNQCLNMRFYGSAMPFPHIQGAFREELVADAIQCVPADGLTAGEAAMAEPLAVALHATRRAGELIGKRVLVAGCGPIGLLAILAARRAGAAEIVAIDLSDFTLSLAAKVGADRAINTCLCRARHREVYADRRTMPSGSGMACRCDAGIGHRVYGSLGSIRHSLTAQSASRKASRRSFGWKRVGLPRSYGVSFARAASLSARWACR